MKYIDKLVKKLVSESLNAKADEISEKINQKLSGEMGEDWGSEDDFYADNYEENEEEEKKKDKSEMSKFKQALERLRKKKYDMEESIVPPAEDFDYVAEGECTEGDCGEMEEELHGNQKRIDVAKPKGKITGADFKKLRSMKEEDTEMEEGNAFTGALAKAKKEGEDSFEVDGKEYDVKNESYSYSISFGKDVLKLTEEEMVSLIEELVIEEKGKSKGMVQYDKVHNEDKKINNKANQDSFKKMKDYVKAGSKGSFETNPKQFPKGNGELAKMDKKAYTPSDAVGEYVDNFAYGGGMADLYTDEIGYNEDWLEKNIEGSAMTGNSPEYANAIDTGYGKKINKRRKEGLYNKEKRQGSYNRVKQPVDVAGENTKSGKLNKMFKNLGESEEKKEILSEEMIRMKEMIGYNKKSQ
jgi:hypothetical protein